MASERINNFLDADESDDDAERGYDSENDLQKGGRSAKRRKVEDDDHHDSGDDSDEHNDNDGGAKLTFSPTTTTKKTKQAHQNGEHEEDDEAQSEADEDDDEQSPTTITPTTTKEKKSSKSAAGELPDLTKPLHKKNLVATETAIKKSGVVYISRVPPFMKPAKVRSLLEPYGKINRMFLAPEDPASHSKRVRNGGNKKRSYTEGWVEFVSKKDAKKVCELLNARTIGGKKGGYYRDDIWNLLYLKGFKWNNLTEQIAAENAERASRMRAEISKSTKENKEFVRNLERAKVLDGMQSKAEAKLQRKKDLSGSGGGGGDEDVWQNNDVERDMGMSGTGLEKERKKRAVFKQVPLAKKRKLDEAAPEPVQRIGSKIF
ncbi:hypothetical protein B0H66DRAFT_556471 [Apodospora peruviana]|uniref:18S rRNA factor 2 n=1 Tax=Apodospora peruviana TaxID=516989 RepID=A0AAE0I4E4_9PEZI|nr:hypothetical protein B0H66DRAFT_556471 [Apodospora peruviana]